MAQYCIWRQQHQWCYIKFRFQQEMSLNIRNDFHGPMNAVGLVKACVIQIPHILTRPTMFMYTQTIILTVKIIPLVKHTSIPRDLQRWRFPSWECPGVQSAGRRCWWRCRACPPVCPPPGVGAAPTGWPCTLGDPARTGRGAGTWQLYDNLCRFQLLQFFVSLLLTIYSRLKKIPMFKQLHFSLLTLHQL